ncbi:MAG: Sir2 silent information regulator family NAD-dependent deacetylase [Clostridia bacterium]|nr:Sir2 silent information regulator family NAD-dependent deacetylase [Clostridia bacterium]
MQDITTHANEERASILLEEIQRADAVIAGAGAGMSAAAGFTYSGARFKEYFACFEQKYGFHDMYSGGFASFESPEEQWAYMSRFIWINRYSPIPGKAYSNLLSVLEDKDFFVITTNVDHCFQKAGFPKERLFYTQGDFGLFQCSKPCKKLTYNNREQIAQMVLSQGYDIAENGKLYERGGHPIQMKIPKELIPHCPHCSREMSMNLRGDDTFVEDKGWHAACGRYEAYIESRKKRKILFLELGVGYNTPGIIKVPFWRMTATFADARFLTINLGDAEVPDWISKKAICMDADIAAVLQAAQELKHPAP